MTFEEARARIDDVGARMQNAFEDGQTIHGGMIALREGMLEIVQVMRELVQTVQVRTALEAKR